MNNKQKFKVGDWVVNELGHLKHITKIKNDCYYAEGEYVEWHGTFEYGDTHFRLWTIQDAKDGDVLADGNLPFIFKKIDTNNYSYAYCGISVDDGFKIESEGKSGEWTWMQDIKPATKEQRDLLFQKMHEAGYEWDAEKKEVRCDGTLQVRVCQPEEESASVIESLEKEDESPQTLAEACEKGVDMSRPLTFDCRLTEFENAVGLEIFDPPFNQEHIRIIKKESEGLLAIARKSFTGNKKIGCKIEGGTMTIFGLSASKKEVIERIIDTWNGEDEKVLYK